MRILSALFDSYDEAASAVRSLKDAGIPADDISLVANNAKGLIKEETHTHSETNAPTGAGLGAATGAGVGLLAGLGALAVPGIGPVVAAGWLLSTAVGAALGATSGGILGALLKAGVTEDDAHVYAEGIRRGGTLVTEQTPRTLFFRPPRASISKPAARSTRVKAGNGSTRQPSPTPLSPAGSRAQARPGSSSMEAGSGPPHCLAHKRDPATRAERLPPWSLSGQSAAHQRTSRSDFSRWVTTGSMARFSSSG